MQLYQIRYFLAVAETLNFTRAAEACNVSQPALTKAIQKLEDEIGTELIRREGRHSHLTAAGKLLRHELSKIESGLADAVGLVRRSLTLDQASLNVAVMCSIGPHRYAGLFKRFKELQPGIKLVLTDVTQMALTDALMDGQVDCAFYAGEELLNHDRITSIPLHKERMIVAFEASHRFASMTEVSMREAAEEPYIDRLHCEFRPRFLQFVEDNDLDLHTAYCSEREDWIQAMISSGNGVAILPEFILGRSDIECRPLSEPSITRDVCLVYVKDREPSAAQIAFQEFMVEMTQPRAND